MAISKEAATHTLIWALRDYAHVTGSKEAFDAVMMLALHGIDHPVAREALDALEVPGVES